MLRRPLAPGGPYLLLSGRHEQTEAEVVIKTVAEADPEAEAALRREIRLLSDLKHPALPALVDSGVVGGAPWYAMPPLAARPLTTWIDQVLGPLRGAETLTEAGLRATVELVRRLCEPLGYLHGEGLVHGDLRPGTLAVRDDGTVVITDLGHASRFAGRGSRELLDVTGIGAGAAPYTAPEQIRGELVDARADLYAVGCLLVELLTGQPPFAGFAVADLFSAHQDVVPEPPSRRVGGVPSAVDRLVTRLLAKDPRDRPGYAADVERALAEALHDTPRPVRAAPYLYRPRLHGRDAQMSRVEAALEALPTHGGRIVLVGGESGAGKTRFVLEAARLAALRDMQVAVGHGEPTGGPPFFPFAGVARLVLDLCRRQPGAVPMSTLKVIAGVDTRFGALVGVTNQPDPPELPPQAARYRLFVAALDSIRLLSQERPLVLVLDDLQWADELTLAVLTFLKRVHLQDLTFLILGTWRTDETSPALEEMLADTDADRVELGPLDERAVTAMVQDMLALDEAPRRLGKVLTGPSGGNPFFVAQYLRAAISDGVLRRDQHSGWRFGPTGAFGPVDLDRVEIPSSARELVRRRLDALPWNGRRVVDAAAVLGRQVPLDLLAPVSGLSEGPLLGGVATALRLQILEESGSALRFVHEPVRRLAYERLDPDLRRTAHRAAAQALEADAGTWMRRLPELGHHWERAGEPARARAVYLAGARTAAARNALGEAEALYRDSLRLADRPADRVAAALELGSDILWIQGRSEEARETIAMGLDAARATGNRPAEARGLLWLGRTQHILGDLHQARELTEASRDLARELGDVAVEGMAVARLAALHHARGQHRQARGEYEEARRLHRLAGDRRSEGETTGNLALLLQEQLGDEDTALALHKEALSIHREVGHRRVEGHVLGNMALVHQRRGELPQARELYEQARAIHREVGDRVFEGIAVSNLASLARDEGDVARAESLYIEALAIHREVKNRHIEAMVLAEVAALERLAHGDLERAEELLDAADAVFEEIGDQLWRGIVRCERGHVALAREQAAQAWLDDACDIAARMGTGLEGGLGRAIGALSRAVQGHRAGEALVRGALVAELPEGFRATLRRQGLIGQKRQSI